jgi:PAS domain S-box-containing protein
MLREQQELFRSVVERIGDLVPFGFWLADGAGALTYVSDSFLEMTGSTLEACAGQGWLQLVHPQDRSRTLARWQACLREEAQFSHEHRVRGRDGAYFTIRSRAVPLREKNGELRAWAGVNLDVTDRKRFVAELRAAKDQAEEASRAKDELVAAVSHELRNPLTPVLAAAHMLEKDAQLSSEAQACVRMIRANTELEARLIDDLVDLTRLLRGKLDMTIEPTDVHLVLSNVLEMCRAQAVDKGVTLSMELRAPYARIRGDGARLQQAFWNLLRNGIHATPRGGSIHVTTESDLGELVVRIRDSGVGIEPERLAGLFAGPANPSAGAHGFGLALAKAVVDMHEGRIAAKSDGRHKGATFEVRLFTMDHDMPSAPRSVPPPERKVRILFVDDHRDTCSLMTSMLTRRGYEVLTAEDVKGALRIAAEYEFDLLVSDLGLPDASGLELMQELKKRGPVLGIAITGFGRDEDVKLCREVGFAEHMTKPINIPKLEAAIKKLTSQP